MRIALGAEHRGHFRDVILRLLLRLGYEVEDFKRAAWRASDYPGIASAVAGAVGAGKADRGILIGRTGMGMCIVANKFPGVRAADCFDEVTAVISRRLYDANVLCLSSELLSAKNAEAIVSGWLSAPFDGGRHRRRLERIHSIERRILRGPPVERPSAAGDQIVPEVVAEVVGLTLCGGCPTTATVDCLSYLPGDLIG